MEKFGFSFIAKMKVLYTVEGSDRTALCQKMQNETNLCFDTYFIFALEKELWVFKQKRNSSE